MKRVGQLTLATTVNPLDDFCQDLFSKACVFNQLALSRLWQAECYW